MKADDPRLRFRVWVDAKLVDEIWVNARDPARLQMVEQVWARHQQIVGQAEADGKRWLIEIYDPAKPHDQALRFGTRRASTGPRGTSGASGACLGGFWPRTAAR
jgi:hypothetical protein